MFNFNGKSALITGGSRGLGQALAYNLASKGAKVVIVAREKSALDETISSIKKRWRYSFRNRCRYRRQK